MKPTRSIRVHVNRRFRHGDGSESFGRGWPKHDAGAASETLNLHDALERRFAYQAFLVGYEPTPIERRLTKDVLGNAEALALIGGAVRMQLFLADVDKHGLSPAEVDTWFSSEEGRKIDALRASHPGVIIYRSKGGYRILGALPEAVEIRSLDDAKRWARLTMAWRAYLRRRFDIHVDPLHDWTRYQRVPHDTRDEGVGPEEREVIGDIEQVGTWAPELSAEDWEESDHELAPKTNPRDPSARLPAARAPGAPTIFRELLKARGFLGAFDGEKFITLCPDENQHGTPLRAPDGSCVLYESDGQWGGIHCLHSNCGHDRRRDARDWMGCFSQSEIDAAKQACGISVDAPRSARTRLCGAAATQHDTAGDDWIDEVSEPGDGDDAQVSEGDTRTEGEREADAEGRSVYRSEIETWIAGQRAKATEQKTVADGEEDPKKKRKAQRSADWHNEQADSVQALLAGEKPGGDNWVKAVWRLVEQTRASVDAIALLCGEDARPHARAARLRRTLDRGDHVELGARLVRALDWGGNVVTHEGQVYRYVAQTGLWTILDAASVSRHAQSFAGCWRKAISEGEAPELKIKSGDVEGAIKLAEAQTAQRVFFENAEQGIAFKNGFLRVENDGATQLVRHSLNHRARYGLAFDHTISPAPPEAWLEFCHDTWGDDTESVALLHQMLGYLLVQDTSMQKIFLLLGPPRSGKGTIIRLIKEIVGTGFTPFKVNRLDAEFGMGSLLGKSVAADSDVRRSTSRNKDEGAIVERLLGISGEDEQAVGIKFKPDVCCRLGVRLVLASNPPFGLRDSGATLASRLVILPFFKSHLGDEDTGLFDKLRAELPGIIQLAIDGLLDLRSEGKFVEPKAALQYRDQVAKRQSPLAEFFEDCCDIGAGSSVETDELYQAMRWWAGQNGHSAPSSNAFGDALLQMGVTKIRPQLGAKRMPRRYVGIALDVESQGFADKQREKMAGLRSSWREA